MSWTLAFGAMVGVDSQLFGHVRGTFTGATEMRLGPFEYPDGGTVFLDEVGETSLAMHSKLLRVIQNREVLAGRFREDLFYRLSSIQIRVPSSTERLEDIPLLVQFFVKKYNRAYGKNISGLTRRAKRCCCNTPGRAMCESLRRMPSPARQLLPPEILSIWEICALAGAQVLGIGRTSLYRYLKRDQIEQGLQVKLRGAAAAGSVRILILAVAKLELDTLDRLKHYCSSCWLHHPRIRTSISAKSQIPSISAAVFNILALTFAGVSLGSEA